MNTNNRTGRSTGAIVERRNGWAKAIDKTGNRRNEKSFLKQLV